MVSNVHGKCIIFSNIVFQMLSNSMVNCRTNFLKLFINRFITHFSHFLTLLIITFFSRSNIAGPWLSICPSPIVSILNYPFIMRSNSMNHKNSFVKGKSLVLIVQRTVTETGKKSVFASRHHMSCIMIKPVFREQV